MNILHVITGIKRAAGTSIFCCEVANGLVAAGHNVTLAVTDPSRKDCCSLDPRVKLISIASLLQTPKIDLQTPDISLRTSNYNIVHIHALWSPVLHKVSNWAKRNQVPIVWSPHGMLTPWAVNNKKWKKLVGWWLYQKWDLAGADLIHATAESEVVDVRRMGLKNMVAVVPLGVRIGGPVEHAERIDGKKILLFVSRVQRKKGLINLVRAWAQLPKEVKIGWKVRIVGPDEDGHVAEVKAECKRMDVAEEWEFAGPRYGADLQCEYDDADLFVLPTHSENFGSVVIEALSHGVPVITTKGTPWQELETYRCGWWIDIGVNFLAEALSGAMVVDDATRREMGERGRRLVRENYTWEAVVKKMINGYEKLLESERFSR